MNDRFGNLLSRAGETSGGRLEEEVVEIPLLLPGWQMSALETAAHRRGLTAAEMVRHLLRDFILEQGPAESCSECCGAGRGT
jgi:hypothetical protein